MGPWFSFSTNSSVRGNERSYSMHCVKRMKGKSGDQNEYSINQLLFYQRSSFYQKAVPIYPQRHDVATQVSLPIYPFPTLASPLTIFFLLLSSRHHHPHLSFSDSALFFFIFS